MKTNHNFFLWLFIQGFTFLVESESQEFYVRKSDTFHFTTSPVLRNLLQTLRFQCYSTGGTRTLGIWS
jgi:hypothetical protein